MNARTAGKCRSGKRLPRFFGTLAPDDADAMAREIENACDSSTR